MEDALTYTFDGLGWGEGESENGGEEALRSKFVFCVAVKVVTL
jgi:hypothetical protein